MAPPRCRHHLCHGPTLAKSTYRPPTGSLPRCYREHGGVARRSNRSARSDGSAGTHVGNDEHRVGRCAPVAGSIRPIFDNVKHPRFALN